MKNNHSLKAIVFFAFLIILCCISIIFINTNKNKNNALLETIPEIKDEIKFTPRESKEDFESFSFFNNLGGSCDEILLDSLVTDKNIIILFETTSTDFDLCENKSQQQTLAISLFSTNGSLLEINYLGNIDKYINSYIKNNFLYIFYNKDTFGFEIKFNLSTKSKETKKHNNKFDEILLISNEFVYIYEKETHKTLAVLDNFFDIPTNYSYFTNFNISNKDYVVFSNLNNFYFYNIQENSFLLTFEECKIIDILSAENEILLLFKVNNELILSKFDKNLEEVFSTHISSIGTNSGKILTKNNGYLIYEINNKILNSYFVCLHGDIIKTNNQTNPDYSYENLLIHNNTITTIGKNKSDNFFVKILNEELNEKKYMALSTSAIYNYNLHIKDDVAILITTTSFNNFEFIDNFGSKDIFLFIK